MRLYLIDLSKVIKTIILTVYEEISHLLKTYFKRY